MKHLTLAFLFFFAVGSTSAQIVNGSFEDNGQGSLDSWNNSCGTAVLLPGGAPGCGDWHVGYPMHYAFIYSCANSVDAIYQELNWLTSPDQVLTIGFWARTPMDSSTDYFFGVECRLSFISNSVFSPQQNSGEAFTPSADWTYHVANVTSNAWQALHPPFALGFVGDDTTETRLMELDGIEIISVQELSTGIPDADPTRILGYYDPTNDAVVINRASSEPMRIIDAAGRIALTPSVTGSSAAQRISVTDLAPGIYTAVAGNRYVRFFKR